MVDYPNPGTAPASLPDNSNYPADAPIPSSTTVSGTSGGSGGYYQGLQAAAAMNQPASSSSATAPIAAAPAAAPAGTSAYAAAPAPHGGFDEEFGAAVAAGQVPWSGLPTEVQADLHNALGAKAPAAYEKARVATAQLPSPVNEALRRNIDAATAAGPTLPSRYLPTPASPQRSFFDPVRESSGIGTGTLAGDVSKGIGNIMAGPGPDQPTPVRPGEGPGGAFGRGFNGPPSPVAAGPPPPSPTAEGPPVTNVAKNVPASAPGAPPPPAAAPGAPPPSNIPGGTIFQPSPPASTFTPHSSNIPGGTIFPPDSSVPPNVPGPEGAAPPTEKTHIVLPGDTLWDIAGTELGNPQRWQQIAAMNGISRSQVRHLQPGTPLKLPTSDADMPTPRQRPTITAPGKASNLNDGSYYGGLAEAAGPPFAGGADAQATSGSRDVAAMPSRSTETAPGIQPEGQDRWDQEDQDFDRATMGAGMQPNRSGLGLYPDKFYDPNYFPAEQMNPNNRPMEDLAPGYERSGELAALSANDNGPRGPAMTNPSKPLPVPYDPNMMQDYYRNLKPLPVSKPANQAKNVGSNLLGGERADTLGDQQQFYGPPPEFAEKWRLDDQIREAQLSRSLTRMLAAGGEKAGGREKSAIHIPDNPRYSTNIEIQHEPQTPPKGVPYSETYTPSGEYKKRVEAAGPMGRPDVPWLSTDPWDPNYGKENPAAKGIPNFAQRHLLNPYTNFSRWSPEYEGYPGLQQFPDINRGY